jgi:hypothetical protein
VGEGFGLRGHWGDKDANGLRDIGYGVDAGPFSMDITTEAHHRLFKTLMGE